MRPRTCRRLSGRRGGDGRTGRAHPTWTWRGKSWLRSGERRRARHPAVLGEQDDQGRPRRLPRLVPGDRQAFDRRAEPVAETVERGPVPIRGPRRRVGDHTLLSQQPARRRRIDDRGRPDLTRPEPQPGSHAPQQVCGVGQIPDAGLALVVLHVGEPARPRPVAPEGLRDLWTTRVDGRACDNEFRDWCERVMICRHGNAHRAHRPDQRDTGPQPAGGRVPARTGLGRSGPGWHRPVRGAGTPEAGGAAAQG